MRLDKYLKVSRIIRRRTVAKEISDAGRIEVNGRVAKSSTSLSIGDEIKIKFGNKLITIKVMQLLDSTRKEDASQMYELLSEERI